MKMFINGHAADSISGKIMGIKNPYNGEIIDTVPAANAEDIDSAIGFAAEAQKSWKKISLYERSEIIYRFADLALDAKEELAKTLMLENGKPISQARADIGNIHVAVKAFCERAKHFYETLLPVGAEPNMGRTVQMVTREPVGIVVAVIPFNFPSNLFLQKVIPSLLTGNSVLVLPPSGNPLTVLKMTELLIKAGVPDGVIQCITAKGAVKESAVKDKRIGLVSLTGSTATGIRTASLCAGNLTPYTLELGGNDPFIVFDDADMDRVIGEVFPGRLINAGQICCASKRFLIHRSRRDEFLGRVTELVDGLKTGNPVDESTNLSCLINEHAAMEVESQVRQTLSEGGRLVRGGNRKGSFFEATIIDDVSRNSAVAKDMEVFGPLIPIIYFDKDEEALTIANASSYGLSSCIFTENMRRVAAFSKELEAGSVIVNAASRLRTFEMPFGGRKLSGVGTEGVMSTFYDVTEPKTIVLKDIL